MKSSEQRRAYARAQERVRAEQLARLVDRSHESVLRARYIEDLLIDDAYDLETTPDTLDYMQTRIRVTAKIVARRERARDMWFSATVRMLRAFL